MRRRAVAAVAVVLAAALAVWALGSRPWRSEDLQRVRPSAPAVAAAEQARRASNAGVERVTLTAAPATVDLGDRQVRTWAFNGTLPGPEIRLRAGDVLQARVRNELPAPLTVHWHGIALRNDMDGVPKVTQAPIAPGESFTYTFTVPDPGTFIYHSHVGTQLDRGLYGALVVEDPADAGTADAAVLLDDWVDGTGTDPDKVLAGLRSGGMAGMDMGGSGDTSMPGMDMGPGGGKPPAVTPDSPLGSDTGDVAYPLYLVNGRAPAAPAEIPAPAGRPLRLRLINIGADTPFRVAVGGARLRVVATDGFAVPPVTVDTLILGMGERYDVVVTVPSAGVVPLVAVAEGKDGAAVAALRSGPGAPPAADSRPGELAGTLLKLGDLRPTDATALPERRVDRTLGIRLTGDMQTYRWGIDATGGKDGVRLPVREGERVRLTIKNDSMMWHPIHLHGHTFQVAGGPRKDTVAVPPGATVTVEFEADNPGQWLLHCHNAYHAEAGMTTVLSYVS